MQLRKRRFILILVLLSIFYVGCENNFENKEPTQQNIEKQDNIVYDSLFVLRKMGKQAFFFIRKNYEYNLNKALKEITKLKNLQYDSLFEQTKTANINYELILNSIPKSPAEFRIYDSYFYNINFKKQIKTLESIIFACASQSDTNFRYKLNFAVLYTNMYAFLYSGIFINEARLDDGYYYYDINSLICKNHHFFCRKVWSKLNKLSKIKTGDLYKLYDCRCKKNNINEFDFCK